MLNRSDLNADITSRVYTNPAKLIKGNTVRDRLLLLSESLLNNISDRDIMNGFLGISSDGLVDISFIKSATPSGLFLKDDGTWSSAGGSLEDTLLIGNTTSGNHIILSNGDYVKSSDARAYLDCGDGGYMSVNFNNGAGVSAYSQYDISGVKLFYENGSDLAVMAQTAPSTDATHTDGTDTSTTRLTPNSWSTDVTGLLGVAVNGGLGFGWVDYLEILAGLVTLKSSAQITIDSIAFQWSSDGGTFAESYILGDAATLSMATVNGAVNLDVSQTQLYHDTQLTFQSPIYHFETLTANSVAVLDVSRNLISADSSIGVSSLYFQTGTGIDTIATGGSDVLNIGVTNANVINYGNSTTVHNFLGTAIYELQVNSYVEDKLITLNYGGAIASGIGVGFEIEEDSLITGYLKTSAGRNGYSFLAPANTSYTDFVFAASVPRSKTFQDTTSTIAEYGNNLSVFAATTSAELAGVVSDETGYSAGALLVFSKSPVIDAPTFSGIINASNLTASSIVETDASKNLVSATKSTAYNKAFGTISGTVGEGNDSRFTDSRKIKSIFSINQTLTHTGDTLETIMYNTGINLNGAFTANDFVILSLIYFGTNAGNNKSLRIYISDSPTALTNQVLVGLATFTTGAATSSLLQKKIVFNNSLVSQTVTQANSAFVGGAEVAVAIDFTTDKYIVVTGQLALGSETMRIYQAYSEIHKGL